jgi:PhzF family phenazine biosynthesis protein
MASPLLFHVDAFTRTPFAGNPAGVVLHADALTPTQMQLIARELKHSETAFVMRPRGPDHQVFVRYFTPLTEVPICGHATVALHHVRALTGEARGPVVQRSAAGLRRVRVDEVERGLRVFMDQGAPQFEAPLPGELRDAVAAALGLSAGQLDDAAPVQVVSTGHSKVMVPLREGVDLDGLAPDLGALARLSARIGCNGWFPFQRRRDALATDGRMFAPAIGIPEDPVTGNANGPLGAYLVRHALMPHDGRTLRFAGHQGRRLQRDGVVHVEVDIAQGQPTRVTIAGDAVVLFAAPLSLG